MYWDRNEGREIEAERKVDILISRMRSLIIIVNDMSLMHHTDVYECCSNEASTME